MAAPFTRIVVIDFETYYDTKEYTLKKMTTEEYVRDSRFKAHGACLKTYGENDNRWVSAEDLPGVLAEIDWSTTAVLAHNAIFDCTILGWRYGVYPAFYIDTLSMARARRGPKGRNSLAQLATDFGLPDKGRAIHNMDGVREPTPAQEQELADYCRHDNWLAEQIFDRLGGLDFPSKELRLIDMVVRMYVQPRLWLDAEMLKNAIVEEAEELKRLLDAVGLASEEELASDDKMAAILVGLGVEVPMKVTPKGNTKPAFAKTDVAFQALLEHENPMVAGVAEARVKAKSTQARTRAQRLYDIALRGPLPVPLHMYGAHTGRIQAAKGEALNMQNMKRGSFLRRAIMAPKGYVVGVVDLAQIEPRVLAWYTDNGPILQAFRAGKDVYSVFGAQMFGIPGLNKIDHPVLRQSAKSALLGCGFGLGWASFAAQLLVGFLGAPPIRYDMPFLRQMRVTQATIGHRFNDPDFVDRALKIPHQCSDVALLLHCVAAKEIIDRYRAASPQVTRFWRKCDDFIRLMTLEGISRQFKNLDISFNQITLPNGLALRYPDLSRDDEGQFSYAAGFTRGSAVTTRIYGPKLTENIVQAVARIVITDGMLRIQKRYPVVLTVPDEAVAIIPEAEAEEGVRWMIEQVTVEPNYLPGIPLAAEGGFASRYGDAKN